jgi:hypothetical protein
MVIPDTPSPAKASRTSSSLCGLMMAMIYFTRAPLMIAGNHDAKGVPNANGRETGRFCRNAARILTKI